MCRPVTCKTCGKTTWAGCGQHITMVKNRVPASQWCPNQHTPAERAAVGQGQGGLLRRLLGRS